VAVATILIWELRQRSDRPTRQAAAIYQGMILLAIAGGIVFVYGIAKAIF
jgi:hypothetical protein